MSEGRFGFLMLFCLIYVHGYVSLVGCGLRVLSHLGSVSFGYYYPCNVDNMLRRLRLYGNLAWFLVMDGFICGICLILV